MRRLLATVAVTLILTCALLAVATPASPPRLPQPFLIFYGGFPDRGSNALAAKVAASFAGYPIVVFGDAWRFPDFATKVMARLPHTTFYGYDDVGHVTFATAAATLATLKANGMHGVLLDDVGTGLSSRTPALQRVVDRAHSLGLAVLLNAWNPQDVLPLQLRKGDGILCENWVFSDGSWHTFRGASVYGPLRTLQARGVLVFMIATAARAPVRPTAIAPGVIATLLTEAGNYVSASGPNYSADSNTVFQASALRRIIARAPAWR